MPITIVTKPALASKVENVTAGNEYIWPIPQGSTFVLQAIPRVAGECRPYTSNDGEGSPASFDDMLPIDSASAEAFQQAPFVAGQRWVGAKVESGEWDITLTLSDKSL